MVSQTKQSKYREKQTPLFREANPFHLGILFDDVQKMKAESGRRGGVREGGE